MFPEMSLGLEVEIGSTEFPEYLEPLTFAHDPMQEIFLNVSGMGCMCERGLREVVTFACLSVYDHGKSNAR